MAAAVALARAGIDVQVYEQARELTEVGAGVSLAPNGLRMLDRLGVGEGIRRLGARHVSAQLRLADGIHSVLQGFVVEPAEPLFSGVVAYRGLVPSMAGYPAGTMRMWVGESKHFLVFPVRAGQLLNYVGF